MKERVYLIGAGPGDPELITVKGYRLLTEADVVVYDRLVNSELLSILKDDCQRIYAGKRKHLHAMPQDQINATLIAHARRGACVVRLKGGDPFVFGRGGEELAALDRAGVPWEVVPGITAAAGAAASVGLSLTHRDFAQAVTLVTAHRRQGTLKVDWDLLLRPAQTVVIYMGMTVLDPLVVGLLERGVSAATNFTVISKATLPDEVVLHSTLGEVCALAQDHSLVSPTLLIMHDTPLLRQPARSAAASPTLAAAVGRFP